MHQPGNALPTDVRAALRFFAFYLANGTLADDVLDGIDYRAGLMTFGSPLEQAFAVFANVLRTDEDGTVLNADEAEHRAAQWLRAHCDPGYRPDPPLAPWETELHGP
ncbi:MULTISPECIES: hypothetical protein [unclassified Streptomyces]|uniref:DUF7677 family protein n=1 Tax=unclassified Streptomyces TaxID=2593676 RepID=UPI002DD8727B|nr:MULTISPECIES: hypothetical protein [unclassified Streptomyces]WSA90874.1 hypothetical protein OIE63_04460 [Streptomyces sp. NBC_01795]WSB75196.1 hypothetical protein OHB04_04990 [Streptomyces sp. NBC_01775]WSS16520.1 hypothetical protein OG533_34910 [Streptomyces sp. NBC_01186]WSS45337.1 hypothetical protein OG220_35590 [Streptomyces sp. NBC_01187]